MDTRKQQTWLIAAWPGMGNVAVLSAGYLVQKLGMKPVGELAPKQYFDIQAVEVHKGVVSTPRLPRSLLFGSPVEEAKSKLLVFLGESQPAAAGYAYAHELLDRATQLGVSRVVTFASMASQLHPSQEPRVFGAATQPDLLEDLRSAGVALMPEGQIAGLNGVLLGAASQRGMAGLCLLGEIPFFAAAVANPKAAKAVLEAFGLMVGLELDLEELARHAKTIDQALIQMLERMEKAAGEGEDPESEFASGMEEPEAIAPPREPGPEAPPETQIDYATRQRVEKLFESARRDRRQALKLKQELDRLGVFKQYEDRFLDLFRRAE
ncbi:MAG TPA: PAC2 family protein [Phycisphaerales bacterium]|nr:PAC2 family protein [Phycisphaerales bacterium]